MEDEEICFVFTAGMTADVRLGMSQSFGETRCRPHVQQLEQNENATDKTLCKINNFILKCLFQSFI